MPWTLTSQKIKWTDNRHIFKGNEALVGVTTLHITSTIGKNNNNNFCQINWVPNFDKSMAPICGDIT